MILRRFLAMNACFKQTVFACLLSVTALLVSACGQKTEEADESSQTNGVYEDSIILGSSSSLTGFVGFLGSEYVKGAQLVFDEVNRTHGIHGREIKLITLDDQYDPAKTVANTQQLIQKDKVFALFNYVGTPTSIAVKDIIREARIPTVGLLTGAASCVQPTTTISFTSGIHIMLKPKPPCIIMPTYSD